MRAIVQAHFGPAEVLTSADVPMPGLRPADLLVRVRAAGVNRADILQREGFHEDQNFGESALLGLELTGEVVAVGSAVTDLVPGARVIALVGGGAYAEYARVDRAMAVEVPAGMNDIAAAATMKSFVTAVEAVHHFACLSAGQTVLVQAAGGIGSACVELGAALGLRVLATTSTHRREDVLGLGAAAVCDRDPTHWEAAVREATANAGANAVIDFVGGATLGPNLRSLKPGGTLVQVGILSGEVETNIPLNLLLHNHLRLQGTVMKSRSVQEKRAMVRRFTEVALPLLAKATMRSPVYAVLPIHQVGEAHRLMEQGGGFGKIVLTMTQHGG